MHGALDVMVFNRGTRHHAAVRRHVESIEGEVALEYTAGTSAMLTQMSPTSVASFRARFTHAWLTSLG
jgi:hypothetical protein